MKFHTALLGLIAASAINVDASVAPTGEITFETVDAMAMAQKLVKSLGYITVTGAIFTGAPGCGQTFSNGNAAVSAHGFPDQGVVLSTGLNSFLHVQDTHRDSNGFRGPGDSDLEAIVEGTTMDACTLEFTFDCTFDLCPVEFQYVFGSEEYLEYVGTRYNDVFAWFLNGKNIALIPGTSTEVSIMTINDKSHPELYIDNPCGGDDACDGAPYPKIQADGFTVALKAKGIAGKTGNTMKMVIADRQDAQLNSWALIKADSFVYVPPSGGGGGDPHFKRWGQDVRDSFHGECDMVMLHAPSFHGKGLDVHVRTTIESFFSYIESAAVRVGKDILEINRGLIVINGNQYSDADLPVAFGEDKYQIVVKSDDKSKRVKYSVVLEEETELEFRYYKQYMTFDVKGHPDFADASGMLGRFPSGDMVARDGDKMLTSFEEFGFEWQVNPAYGDAQLFADQRAPQLPYEACRVPTAAMPSQRKLRGNNTQLFKQAQKACAQVYGSDFNLCVNDVMMTGDIELAGEW